MKTMLNKGLVLLVAVFVLLSIGCSSISRDYVEADKAYYNAIALEYLDLVQNAKKTDGSSRFTQEEQERRTRTIQTWRLMIEKAGGK